MKRTIFLVAGLALAIVAHAAEDRLIEHSQDSKGLEGLGIDANVGSIDLVGWDKAGIEIEVKLEDEDRGWGWRNRSEKAIAAAELKIVERGNRLFLEIDYGDEDDDDVEEHWTVRAPQGFSIEAELNVGEMEIDNFSGGVDADLNVGELVVSVPRGDVHAEGNVGEVSVESETDSLGDVSVETNVGDALLRIRGDRIRATGPRFSPGGEASYSGDGDDDIVAEVNVGEASVIVR